MKIICDSCGTKYSISDEKVKGKVFKIRCKKCQHIIVVRGTPADDGPADQPAAQPASEGAGDQFGDTPIWHVVVDREQVGPMTAAEVRDRFSAGEINADTYIWREGFADWVRLATVDDFSDLQAPEGAAPAAAEPAAAAWGAGAGVEEPAGGGGWGQAPAADDWGAGVQPAASGPFGGAEPAGAFGGAEPAGVFGDQGGGFGQQAGGGMFGDQPATESPFGADSGGAGGDLFGGAAAAQQPADQGGVFAPAPQEQPAPGGDNLFGGGGQGQQLFPDDEQEQAQSGSVQMTGQRGENSVLFSLSNLQHLAMGGAKAPVVSPSNGSKEGGGSGLIDIRSMAASTASPAAAPAAGGDDELPVLGGFSAPVAAAPVLMPAVGEERPKWLLPTLIGGGSLMLVVITVLVVVLVTKEDKPPIPPPGMGALAKAGLTNPQAGAAGQKAGATENAAAAGSEKKADDKTDKASEEGETKPAKKAGRSSSRCRGKKGRRSGRRSARAETRDEPEPKRPASSGRRKKRDALDDLIDGALGGGGRRSSGGGSRSRSRPKAAAPAENLPESLTRAQIQGGMRRIKGRVQGCYDKFKVPGLANVKVRIDRSGRVGSAQIKGVFSGTPTGACVLSAVRSASFPRFKGTPITITYPFVLR